MTDLKTKMREILGEDATIGSFAFRRPATAEESKMWEAEGVVINPTSLDDVIEVAKRREGAKPQRSADQDLP